MGAPSDNSCERLIKQSRGIYLLNVFKAIFAILLISLSLLCVVIRYPHDQTILLVSDLISQNFQLLRL